MCETARIRVRLTGLLQTEAPGRVPRAARLHARKKIAHLDKDVMEADSGERPELWQVRKVGA